MQGPSKTFGQKWHTVRKQIKSVKTFLFLLVVLVVKSGALYGRGKHSTITPFFQTFPRFDFRDQVSPHSSISLGIHHVA